MQLGTHLECVRSSPRVSGACQDGTRYFARRRPRLVERLSGVAKKLVGKSPLGVDNRLIFSCNCHSSKALNLTSSASSVVIALQRGATVTKGAARSDEGYGRGDYDRWKKMQRRRTVEALVRRALATIKEEERGRSMAGAGALRRAWPRWQVVGRRRRRKQRVAMVRTRLEARGEDSDHGPRGLWL
ncbi:hypothetical protein BHM03_00008590 [Ensete ventricosum]|nr:hypothetical protein BHM03_00008590 [Ensete ventricosum]